MGAVPNMGTRLKSACMLIRHVGIVVLEFVVLEFVVLKFVVLKFVVLKFVVLKFNMRG